VRKNINFFNCTWVLLDVFEAKNVKRLNCIEIVFLANYKARGILKVSSISYMESRIISCFCPCIDFFTNFTHTWSIYVVLHLPIIMILQVYKIDNGVKWSWSILNNNNHHDSYFWCLLLSMRTCGYMFVKW